MKTPRTIHYSQLKYENIPHKRGGRARVWYLEYEYKHVWSGIYKDLRLLFWRVLKWLKIEYRKEFLFGFMLLFALIPSPAHAMSTEKPVNVNPNVNKPFYTKPIPKLSPVVPVAFSVPDKVEPIVPPPAPVAAPVAAPSAPVASSGCVTGYSTGDYYLDKIIGYESGGNSCATNPGGCYGLLQACPGEPLRAACGGSPSCQIAWFQANKTGGRSWAQVWQHEEIYGWW